MMKKSCISVLLVVHCSASANTHMMMKCCLSVCAGLLLLHLWILLCGGRFDGPDHCGGCDSVHLCAAVRGGLSVVVGPLSESCIT